MPQFSPSGPQKGHSFGREQHKQ
ncbi:unnamed protein product [Gulo gulo]|uniref:Uncharacterized protein n=1 Tax=Gulo gulo TaxID=48420 RepID=A0A9X9M258_GULGU|nr:unnamed protein product [Gulo gulo]